MQITLVFPPRDHGRSKLAGSQPSCHSFPPAKKSSCYLCTKKQSVSDPRLPAIQHRGIIPTVQQHPLPTMQTQELSGTPWTNTDEGERPLLLSYQETSRKAGLLCQEPSPTMTGSHLLFLKTLDPKERPQLLLLCQPSLGKRRKV